MNVRRRMPHEHLAERLREAHERLRSLSASEQEKSRLFRRLVAISDAAKRDAGRAARRLELLLHELHLGSWDDPADRR